jgi:SAM-dependent methyltransferase
MLSGLFETLNLYPVKRRHAEAYRRFAAPILSGRVLDIGAGKKPFRLPEEVSQYIALDRFTGGEHPPDIRADAMRMPFRENSFDSAICTEVLEHLPEPLACIQEIGRVLRPGGRLYLTAPMCWQLHYAPRDYYRFTRFGLKHLLGKASFRVESVHRIGKGAFAQASCRLTDAIVSFAYRLAKPLDLFLSTKNRVRIVSILLAIPFFLLDRLADILDMVIRSDDAVAWALVAVKHTGSGEERAG